MDYPDVNKDIKKFKTILKNKQYPLISPFLEPFSEEERYKIVWYLIVEKLKYFTADAFRIILPMCKKLRRSYVVTHFLVLYRYDLADICREIGWKPTEKYIKGMEDTYKKYCNLNHINKEMRMIQVIVIMRMKRKDIKEYWNG